MIDLKKFREANNLLQKDVADYIGVSRGYIAMVETGKANMPYKQVRKLLNNALGWDISMLMREPEPENKIGDSTVQMDALRRENEMLREQNEELKREKAAYWEMITRLTSK